MILGTFPKDSFQVATSPRYFPKLKLPKCSLRRLRGPNLTFGKLPFGKLHIWEVASKEFVTREVAVWKVPNTDAMILYIRALP